MSAISPCALNFRSFPADNSLMATNKKLRYLQVVLAVNLFGIISAVVTTKWDDFKDWAMERKAQKMMKVVENGFCGADAKCKSILDPSIDLCAKSVNAKRSNKASPDFSSADRRLAIGCMQKGFMAFGCEQRKDEKCSKRVTERYDKCYDYAYPPDSEGIPPSMGSSLTGCLYGVIFVQDESGGQGGGFSAEEISLSKKKKPFRLKPFNGLMPGAAELNELKEAIAEMGAERIDNFNEAMDALQADRGGAAIENTAAVDVFNQESALKSAGIEAPATDRAPSAETGAPQN